TTALLPVRDVVGPGRSGHAQVLTFIAVFRIAGDGPEAPDFLTGLGIVGSDPATCAEFTAGTSHEHLALGHARRHGDGVLFGHVTKQAFRHRIGIPQLFAGFGVDGHEVGIQHTHVNLAVVDRQATVDQAQAGIGYHQGRVGPDALAVARVEGMHDVAGGGDVEHAVDIERRAVLV